MYRLRHFGDFKHIYGGTQAFSGASCAFQVGDVRPGHGGGSGSGLSDWGRFVRENGFLIPLALFAMFLVASVVYRQVVSSSQHEQYTMLADS